MKERKEYTIDRRNFLRRSLIGTGVAATGMSLGKGVAKLQAKPVSSQSHATNGLHLAPFRFDVTPPLGHSLCGGWITPVEGYDDPLEALGFVLLGAGDPIVLCTVDWTGILNEAHLQWRKALAETAGTTPDRVAVHCVHQHDAPFVCLEADSIVRKQGDLPPILDPAFFQRCLEEAKEAVDRALQTPRPVTHIASGRGEVRRVASNRRILGADGRVEFWRGSSTRDPRLRELPEGLIDPWLRTVAFYHESRRIAACHYYATHPMSHYGRGRVSSDFAGLARKRRQAEDPECLHLYFTGCAGNIAAGKYNDGSQEARIDLTQRIYTGVRTSETSLRARPLSRISWRTHEILPNPRADFSAEELEREIANRENRVVDRNRPAFTLSWLRRCRRGEPLLLSSLHLDDVVLLHLPAEAFVEYQLRVQELFPDRFIATAAYGDGGPWYIPVREAYEQGGYEVDVAFCEPDVDPMLMDAISRLVGDALPPEE